MSFPDIIIGHYNVIVEFEMALAILVTLKNSD